MTLVGRGGEGGAGMANVKMILLKKIELFPSLFELSLLGCSRHNLENHNFFEFTV